MITGRDERTLDSFWVDQLLAVGQPSEVGLTRFLTGHVLCLDGFAVYNPRHAYTENVITLDTTVPGSQAHIVHDVEIADGVEILIEDGGELLAL